ncbi:hypothetical protein NUSPORA_01520 [Nucleospora cyclopteri]
MSTPNQMFKEKKERVLYRLCSSIKQTNSLLSEINQDLEEIVESNRRTVEMCEIYELWISRIEQNE